MIKRLDFTSNERPRGNLRGITERNPQELRSILIPRKRDKTKSWIGVAFLIVIALIYCAPALTSPFWGDNDSWSNLLPIIHYRISILTEHAFPLFTKLWYGGRAQWQNPLWSFFYFPATLVWFLFPLDWGARIIYSGHLIFSLLAGKKLGSLFLTNEMGRISAAIILTSPMLPALQSGHIEKVMAWGWLLFSLYFLLNENNPPWRRGVCSGVCWGIMALTGDNYHVFYAGLLLVPLALSFKKPALVLSLAGGAVIGLIHLPSVWYLIGVARGYSAQCIQYLRVDFLGLLTALTMGITKTYVGESWALIGVPVVYLFIRSIFFDLKDLISKCIPALPTQKFTLLLSIVILSLLATGTLYQGNHLFDTFRIPTRATSLIAVAIMLFVLLSFAATRTASPKSIQNNVINWFLLASAIQVGILAVYLVYPSGARHSPSDPEAQQLAELLRDDQAASVWFSTPTFSDMYIPVALTQHGITLPNVYYGDMGQTIPVRGPYCGYSFDHLIIPSSGIGGDIELISDISSQTLGRIPFANLQLIDQLTIGDQPYNIYRVVCNS